MRHGGGGAPRGGCLVCSSESCACALDARFCGCLGVEGVRAQVVPLVWCELGRKNGGVWRARWRQQKAGVGASSSLLLLRSSLLSTPSFIPLPLLHQESTHRSVDKQKQPSKMSGVQVNDVGRALVVSGRTEDLFASRDAPPSIDGPLDAARALSGCIGTCSSWLEGCRASRALPFAARSREDGRFPTWRGGRTDSASSSLARARAPLPTTAPLGDTASGINQRPKHEADSESRRPASPQ
jgi:hypothetical protein